MPFIKRFSFLFFFISAFFFLFHSCNKNELSITVTLLETPANNSGEPNLFVSATNEIFLSWVEYLNDTTDALLFSKLEDGNWNEPIEIARGANWFVNWADFPSLIAYQNGSEFMAAHWLQKSAGGTYDYDIHISQSQDYGENWEDSFIIHRDSIAAEHGFMTMIPIENDRVFATWLDGRNTKIETESKDNHGHGQGGAMTLRTAEFDIGGHYFEEAELDNRICDCCQTDAAMTSEGMVVVYRDRSEHEIRDISIVRKIKGNWTTPHTIHADNWEITGCPVNGPAVDAINKNIAVAWFTAANSVPSVKIAFSNDAGKTFNPPVLISKNAPLGRVDVVLLSEKEAIVSWLEETEEGTIILAKKVHQNGGISKNFELIKTDASRQSGFPILVKNGADLILAWTEVDSLTKVKTAILQ